MNDKIRDNAKAITAFFTALGTWGATAAADGSYNQVELWGLCGVVVTTMSVWTVRYHVQVRSSKTDPPLTK